MADENQVNVAITATSDQLEAGVNAAAESVSAGTEKMSASVEHMAETTAEATEESESAFRKLADTVGESVTEMNEKLEGFSRAVATVQKSFALLGEVAILGFVGEKIADLAKEFAEFAEQTEIASQKTGLSTNAVQELGFAAKMTGVSAEGMNQALMRVSRAQTEAVGGSKQLQAVFEAVGLSAKQLEDMSLDQVLEKVADKFESTEDGSTKAAIAMQLFGRQGADLIPLLDKGSSGIDELRQKAEELGIVMGGEDVEAGAKLNEKLKEMDAQMAAIKLRAGSELAPAFLQIVNAMSEMDNKGGVLDTMFIGLADIMKTLVAAGIYLANTFNAAAEVIVTAGVAAEQAATGNFKTAAASIQIGIENIEAASYRADAAVAKLFGDMKDGSGVDMGNEEGNWEKKGKLKAPESGGDKGAASQVSVWKAQLQEQEEASGQYFKNNLKEEQAFWEQKLGLVKSGSKDYVAIEHELYQIKSELAHQDLAQDLGAMHEQMATAQSGSLQKIQIASAEAERIGQAYGFQSAQYKAALSEMLKAGKEYSDAQVQLVVDGINRQEQQMLAGVARADNAEKAKYKAHQESTAQETADLIANENQRFAIESDAIAKEMGLYDQDSKQYQKLLDQKLKATEDHTTSLQKINEQGAQQTQQAWDQAFKQIDGSINQSIMGMIKGTETLHQAVVKVANQVLTTMITSILQVAERWIAGEAQKIGASQAASAVLNALGLRDSAVAQATQSATGTSEVASQAGVAAAGAYAATAAIPYIGPALAPAAAAEAMASVMAFEGMASAAGGFYNVPTDQIAQIHQNEMVLPAWAAQGMRNMIGGGGAAGGAGGAAGGHTFHNNMTVNNNGLTDGAFRSMAMKHADVIAGAVKGQLRNFQR